MMGQTYPLSIGTALALETIFGVNPDKPLIPGEIPPYRRYDCMIISVRTLIRNILHSIKPDVLPILTDAQLLEILISEMRIISSIVTENTNKRMAITFYYCDYKKLHKVLKKANLKDTYTPRQQVLFGYEVRISEMLFAHPITTELSFEKINERLSRGKVHNLLISHYPVDLLLHNFKHVDLLESNTGTIKGPSMLYTKLKNASEFVPFNKWTIQIYGDHSGMIKAHDTKLLKAFRKFVSDNPSIALMNDERLLSVVNRTAPTEIRSFFNSAK